MIEIPSASDAHCSTLEVARQLGMAVRSVQLMVDRGELEAWKTPGGHRRILRVSVERWLAQRRGVIGLPRAVQAVAPAQATAARAATRAANSYIAAPVTRVPDEGCVLVIEDSKHFQNLVSLLLREYFPQLEVKLADDGIAGLAMAGQLQPRVLIVDILLPGIDGATLIMSLRSQPQFAASRLIVITSLDEADLAPYRFALEGVTVVHKSCLVTELPPRLRQVLGAAHTASHTASQ